MTLTARERGRPAPAAKPRTDFGPSSRSSCRGATSTRTGVVHRDGVMRLATAKDEIVPQRDPRVRENEAYLTVLLLSRVITRLGTLPDVHPGVIENLFASDLAFLQDLYRRINQEGSTQAVVTCPACSNEFTVEMAGDQPGGVVTYPAERLFEEVAYVAYHFHWSLDEILESRARRPAAVRPRDLEHQPAPDRRGVAQLAHALAVPTQPASELAQRGGHGARRAA